MGRLILFALLLCVGCRSDSAKDEASPEDPNVIGEYIYRMHDEHAFVPPEPVKSKPLAYPWDASGSSQLPRITKEYFRCKGSALNPRRTVEQNGEIVPLFDCGGPQKHSLPLRDGKEFIYPILIDLLNHIQIKTGKRVIITSGYRCPEHNAYINSAKENQTSKHMVGAEVTFYVLSMENNPEAIVRLIQDYYKISPKYKGQKEFIEFKRYEKEDTNVSTQPWYNKEIFIKLFKKNEGRDLDNRHPYPYISLQVRYDIDKQEKVIYDWNTAFRNYMRY
jgi:hypothetical protein